MLRRNHLVIAFGLGGSLSLLLEFFGEWLVVEKRPRVIEFAVPMLLKFPHRRKKIIQFHVTNQRKKSGIYAR